MSEFNFDCPSCGISIEADESVRGSEVECPSCGTRLNAPELKLETGVELDGFKLVRRLGAGGMGEVWLAKQESLGRYVAFKILAPKLAHDQEFVGRFMQEVKMLGMLNHPNIITAYQAGICKGINYVAMEYVDGVELGSRLKIDKIIPERDALLLVRRMAEALSYAWTKFKVLHRDIKPENIMISSESGEPELMDLGISKSMDSDCSLTMTGVVMGTPYYMSPEQARADKSLDCRADIYSLGATLFHMVAGAVPYEGPTALSKIAKHLSPDPTPSPRMLNQDITPQCAALVKMMIEKDREKRQSDWEEVIQDIDRVLAGEYPDAGENATNTAMQIKIAAEKKEKAPKRSIVMPVIAWTVRAILLGVIAVMAYMVWQPTKKEKEPEELVQTENAPKQELRHNDPAPLPVRRPEPESRPISGASEADQEEKQKNIAQQKPEEPAKPIPPPETVKAKPAEELAKDSKLFAPPVPEKREGGVSEPPSTPFTETAPVARPQIFEFMMDIGRDLFSGRSEHALKMIREEMERTDEGQPRKMLSDMKRLCKEMKESDSQLLEAFKQAADKGEIRMFEVAGGRGKYKILQPESGLIRLREQSSGEELSLRPNELALSERLPFAKSEEVRHALTGIDAAQHGDPKTAMMNFSQAGALQAPLKAHFLRDMMTRHQPPMNGPRQNEPPPPRHIPGSEAVRPLFKGVIENFNPATLDIELRYDFRNENQFEGDWTPSIKTSETTTHTEEGFLSFSAEGIPVLWQTKAHFDSFTVTTRCSFTGNGFMQGAGHDTEGGLFIIASLGNLRDGYLKGKIAGGISNATPIGPSEFKQGMKISTEISFDKTILSFKAGKRKWPSTQIKSSNGACIFLGAMRAANNYDEIIIKGRLNRTWYESASPTSKQ